jgi:UDP-N-acetylmuramate: L-alanyl-gamma-D-glutamyl-meso-diaminopimelate ligase
MAGLWGERRTVESLAIIPRNRFMHIHILGICGTFMGGIALLARAAGHRVTGCDANVYPPMSTQLEEQGIELVSGYDVGSWRWRPTCSWWATRSRAAIPLLEAILERNLAYVSGPQWLAQNILQGRWVLGVAGTHGKTTTTSC